jgi:hypothetical protein
MIGLGTWEAHVEMMVYTGDIKFDITDEGGKYGLRLYGPEKFEKILGNVTYEDINADGNTLSGKGVFKMGISKVEVFITATFDGDTFTGTLEIPKLKRVIPIQNGRRVG